MALKLYTAPTLQALTLAEAKAHLRVDAADDDTLIQALISAATQDAEHLMGRAVLPQKWLLTLDAFPSGLAPNMSPFFALSAPASIALQRPTVTGIDSVQYIDATTGTLTTLPNNQYQPCLASDFTARIVPAYNTSWPATRAQPEAVQVLFTTGYPDAASVPELIKAWIKLRIGSLYETRQSWTMGQREALQPNPFIDFLLDRYRVWTM